MKQKSKKTRCICCAELATIVSHEGLNYCGYQSQGGCCPDEGKPATKQKRRAKEKNVFT